MSNRRLLLGLSNGIIDDGKWHRLYDLCYIEGRFQTSSTDSVLGVMKNRGLSDYRYDTFVVKKEDIQFNASNFKTVTNLIFTYSYNVETGYNVDSSFEYHFDHNGNVIKTVVNKNNAKQEYSGLYKEDIELIDRAPKERVGSLLTINIKYNLESGSAITNKFYYKIPVIYNKTKNLTYIPYYQTFPYNSVMKAVHVRYFLNGDTSQEHTFYFSGGSYLGDYSIEN